MSRSHRGGVIPREQIVDLALLVALNDGGEGGGQPSVRIDPVHFAGLGQRGDDGPVFGTGVMTSEERVLPVKCDRTDGPLDGIVVELSVNSPV